VFIYYILVPCVIASIAIGLLVVLSNRGSVQHLLYGVLSGIFIAMSVANTLSLQVSPLQAFYVHTVMAATSIGVFFMYLFSKSLNDSKASVVAVVKDNRWSVTVSLLVLIIDYSQLLFTSIPAGSPPRPEPGIGMIIFVAHFLYFSFKSLAIAYNK
jgi:hypothetical protein